MINNQAFIILKDTKERRYENVNFKINNRTIIDWEHRWVVSKKKKGLIAQNKSNIKFNKEPKPFKPKLRLAEEGNI